MRGQACRAVSTVLHASVRTPSRCVAGRRYALPHRNLHSSQRLLYADSSPGIPETAHPHGVDNSANSAEENSNTPSGHTFPGSSDAPSEPPGKPVDNGSYGSALRRKGRNVKKSTGVPPFQLPERFLEENACLREDPPTIMQERTGTIVGADTSFKTQTPKSNELAIRIASFYAPTDDRGDAKLASQVQDPAATKQNLDGEITHLRRETIDLKRETIDLEAAINDNSPVWRIDDRILDELEFLVRAGLADPAREQIDTARSKKPHLVLHYPRKGGTVFLDALIRHLVDLNHADLIKLDAQDLAEIGGEFLDEPEDPHSEPLSSLGYVVHAPEEAQDPSLGLRDDTAATTGNPMVPNFPSNRPGTVMVIPANSKTLPSLADLLQGLQGKLGSSGSQQQPQLKAAGATAVESTRDLKLAVFLDTILHACDIKRGMRYSKAQLQERATPNSKQNVLGPPVQPGSDTNHKKDVVNTQRTIEGASVVEQRSANDLPESAPTLVLQIKDYPEIFRSDSGYKLLVALHNALYQRRMEGQRIMLIGTCAAENPDLADPAASITNLLQEYDTGLTRNIMTPPILDRVSDGMIQLQHWVQNTVINYKHLRHMIRRLAANPEQVDNTFTTTSMMVSTGVLEKLHSRVWSPEYVHRVCTLVTGIQAESGKALNMQHLIEALELAEGSDEARNTWLSSEKERVRNPGSENKAWSIKRYGSGSKKDRAQLEKECNRHEKKLLNGMIDPSDIRTTFENVHASKETIQTLKDLTLLPLACPQEFDYGVLAEQSISGLLLYGPPGTGKTLLAKAVAKEGGATILEISGAGTSSLLSHASSR